MTIAARDISRQDRIDCGKYLAELRKSAGLTGTEVAERLEVSKAFVSQTETGKVPVKPLMIARLAEIYGIETKEFARKMLRYRDPVTFALIFGVNGDPDLRKALDDLGAVDIVK